MRQPHFHTAQHIQQKGCVASTVFKGFPDLVKTLEALSIAHFSKTIKHAVCSDYRRCNKSRCMPRASGVTFYSGRSKKWDGVSYQYVSSPPFPDRVTRQFPSEPLV